MNVLKERGADGKKAEHKGDIGGILQAPVS
jgi:hypothetical protein